MPEQRIDIGALGHGGHAAAAAIEEISKAVARASWPASTEITFLTDKAVPVAAIVPADWARAMAEIMRDPGAAIAAQLATRDSRSGPERDERRRHGPPSTQAGHEPIQPITRQKALGR